MLNTCKMKTAHESYDELHGLKYSNNKLYFIYFVSHNVFNYNFSWLTLISFNIIFQKQFNSTVYIL